MRYTWFSYIIYFMAKRTEYINIRTTKEVKKKAEKDAKKTNRNMTNMIETLILEYQPP